jgi:hypothetical protein
MHPRTARYLVQFACFGCQKSFKRASEGEVLICPNCGGVAHEMGRNFRAPKREDREQWEKVRILYDGGVRFWGSGWFGRFPETPAEAIDFVKQHRPELDRQEANYRAAVARKKERELEKHEKARAARQKRKAEESGTASTQS